MRNRGFLVVLGLFCFTPTLPVYGQPQAPQSVLRVASVQMRSTPDLQANVKRAREHLRVCAARGVQVAVFPECCLSGYFEEYIRTLTETQLEKAIQEMAKGCQEAKIAALVGCPVRQGEKLYNSAIVINAAGEILERYHKIQLAERWPTAGEQLSVFRLAGIPCTVIICHDERYPELVRLPVLAGARLVFYLSHESGIREERKIGPYRAQIQARAVENTVYIAQANAPANPDASGSHGQSRLIAPDGNILQEASLFQEDILVADLDMTKATAALAQRSLTRGPFGKWYEEGVKKVKILP